MFHLTKHEKGALLFLTAVIVCGAFLNETFKHDPRWLAWLNDQEKFVYRTDVNASSFEELVRVPYIGEKAARRIVEYRSQNGQFRSWDEVKTATGIFPSVFSKAVGYLKI